MDANKHELILNDEVYAVISSVLEIINGLGHGLHKKLYENSLAVEFRHREISCEQQRAFPVVWRATRVGEFIPDLIAYGQIVIDTKTIDRITDLPVDLIINFKKPKLEWECIVLTS